MLFSHRFGSVETLSRAQYWLTRQGFEVLNIDEPTHDVSRLTLKVDFSKASAAMALIDSIERSDPDGWPASMAPTKVHRGHSSHSTSSHSGQHAEKTGTPIHWHAREEASPTDPITAKVSEYMFSRWE